MSSALDCTTCGACCKNPDENVAENYPWYLEVHDTPLLQKPALKKKHVVHDANGVPHLRLDPSGRCWRNSSRPPLADEQAPAP